MSNGNSLVCKGDCLAILLASIEYGYPVDYAVITRQKDITYVEAKNHIIERCRSMIAEEIKTMRDEKRVVKMCKLYGEVGYTTDEYYTIQKQIENLTNQNKSQSSASSNVDTNILVDQQGRGRSRGRRWHFGILDTNFNIIAMSIIQLIIDSGCSQHFCEINLRHLMKNIRKITFIKFYTAKE